MMKRLIQFSSGIIFTLCSLNGLAAKNPSMINITVHTSEKGVAAIGCRVGKTKFGGPGASYSFKGPGNRSYLCGFRKEVNGPNIPCGSLKLSQDSDVSLSMKDNECQNTLTLK